MVTIYTYHEKPPLVINAAKKQGMYYDFVRHINTINEKYHFEIVPVPRKRVERMLENDTLNGILLGVNPLWFNDPNEHKFLWTHKVFTDRDEIVSLKEQSIEYNDQTSLVGKIFGGVRGFYYYGINELVEKNKIIRVNTTNEIDLFTMLINKRIDSAVISRSTFNYLVKKNHWQEKFYLSKKPHDIFDRRILIPKKYHDVYQHLNPIIQRLQLDDTWLTAIRY